MIHFRVCEIAPLIRHCVHKSRWKFGNCEPQTLAGTANSMKFLRPPTARTQKKKDKSCWPKDTNTYLAGEEGKDCMSRRQAWRDEIVSS